MASSPHFIWIYSAWTQTKEVSLPSHVYYSFLLKAHYFTAGCVRGGPSLWTLCRGCINQTSHSGEGSTHWHGTAHSTLEDKRKNTQPMLLLWNIYSFWRPLLIIFTTITPHLFFFQRLSQRWPMLTKYFYSVVHPFQSTCLMLTLSSCSFSPQWTTRSLRGETAPVDSKWISGIRSKWACEQCIL